MGVQLGIPAPYPLVPLIEIIAMILIRLLLQEPDQALIEAGIPDLDR